MSDFKKDCPLINIEDELKKSYLDYAMSVIISRALPDARDGLKPVHRRVLYAMNVLNNNWNKGYKKSARIVGDVIGKYHPHGDAAVYDAIVRMAQSFSLRYVLIDGQGNFGSIDGDSAAAMRYTEIRLSKISDQIMLDLDKETVNFVDNYDETDRIPDVMPTRIPNLLVNGASGIAVGMATNIPPHNLKEVINGCLAYIEDTNLSVEKLMNYISGPDFPTAAIINGHEGIKKAYLTGRGKICVRARAFITRHSTTGKENIIVNEIPYHVNKSRLMEKLSDLIKEKKLEGISALRDESDKDGMRIVIEVKRGAIGKVVLNNLYSQTQMQISFGINMVALHQGQPKVLNLKELIQAFVSHRKDVVTRRTVFELKKARHSAHLLEALAIVLTNVNSTIDLIKRSPTPAVAKERLASKSWDLKKISSVLLDSKENSTLKDKNYCLTNVQIQAIMDLSLNKFTGLEHQKIIEDYKGLLKKIAELTYVLKHPKELMALIHKELILIRDNFSDERRTEIINSHPALKTEDLIIQENVVVTLSYQGYIKYQPLSDYNAQRRGGKGKSAVRTKVEDFVSRILVTNTHDTILCFSNHGRLYWLKVYQLPESTRNARGRPIINQVSLEPNERITAILPVKDYKKHLNVFMVTSYGIVKKTPLEEFSRPRLAGIIALNLNKNDELIEVSLTSGKDEIMLFTANNKVLRFRETCVRKTGRSTTGVRGIRLEKSDKVVSMIIPRGRGSILIVTQNGYGKRTPENEFPIKSRATRGVIAIKYTRRNGAVIGAAQVSESDQVMMITDAGTLVRTRVSEISTVSRNTQGVILIRTADNENVVGLQRVSE